MNKKMHNDLVVEASGRLTQWGKDTEMRCDIIDPSGLMFVQVSLFTLVTLLASIQVAKVRPGGDAALVDVIAKTITSLRDFQQKQREATP